MLNPDGAWFWMLYSLAGAAVAVGSLSFVVNAQQPAIRDALAMFPGMRAMVAMVLWLFWPLVAAFVLTAVVACGVTCGVIWLWDSLVYAVKWCLWKVRVHWNRNGQEGDGSGEQA
jgi:hypothetical protein